MLPLSRSVRMAAALCTMFESTTRGKEFTLTRKEVHKGGGNSRCKRFGRFAVQVDDQRTVEPWEKRLKRVSERNASKRRQAVGLGQSESVCRCLCFSVDECV